MAAYNSSCGEKAHFLDVNNSGDKTAPQEDQLGNTPDAPFFLVGGTPVIPACKCLLVLGDDETGKTSLVAKMQGNDDPKKGSGLEFHHLLVRDEYRDETTRLGVWVLDGVPHQNLLKFALNEDNFPHTTVLLIAAMTTPWDIIDSLEKWANLLDEHIETLKMKPEKLNYYKQINLRRYKDYISPGDEIEGIVTSPIKPRRDSELFENMSASHIMSNGDDCLPVDTLTHNLGLDIIVVIAKTDYMLTLEKEFDYKEEAFDFIQQAIRKFCLKYGASLFYVSAKANKNCDLLYKYIVHRIYKLPFQTPALVVEKDAIFIPAGWDNEKKIAILYENIQSFSPDENYNDVISKPVNKEPLEKNVDTAEEDQTFLLKMQAQLNQNTSGGPATQSPSIRPAPGMPKTIVRKSFDASSPGVQADPTKGTAGEGVLQNFFNSLLNRKSGAGLVNSPGSSPRSNTDNKNRVDVASELDRIAGQNKIRKTPTSSSSPDQIN